MLDFLFHLSDVTLFIVVSVVSIGVSVGCIFLIGHFFPAELRDKHNAVIGNISSLIGIIYGVLAGLTALYLINNINFASDAAQREANAAANIYRDTKWLEEPMRSHMKSDIKNYLVTIINVEWPLMQKGLEIRDQGEVIIDHLSLDLSAYKTNVNSQLLIIQDILQEIKVLYNARETRISMSRSELNNEIWLVIIIGTVLTIGVNYLFGVNLYVHIITVAATALMASAMLFLLIALDKPLQGDFIVEPNAFYDVLTLIERSDITENPILKNKIGTFD